MKTIEEQKLEDTNHFLRAWNKQHYKAGLFVAIPSIAGFLAAQIVPSPFGIIAMAVGPAIGLSIGVRLIPNDFRSRSGSVTPAICLVVAMWIAALVTTVSSLLGYIE